MKEFVELPKPDGKDDVLACMGRLTEVVNVLGKRNDAEARANVDECMKEFELKLKAHDEQIKANGRMLHAGDAHGYGNLAKFSRSVQVPDDLKGIDQTYYNMMVLSAEEAAHVAHLEGRRGLEHAIDSFGIGQLREMQELNDELFWYDTIMAGNGRTVYAGRSANPADRMKRHPKWDRWAKMTKDFHRALDETTANEGKEWVPTILSARLVELIQPELRVSQLFEHLAMSSQNVDLPVLKADFIAGYATENYADVSGAGQVAVLSGDATASNFSNKVSLIAKKLAAKVLCSTEVLEDSIIPLSSTVPRLLAKALGRGIENALINGDLLIGTGSAQDFDLQGAGFLTDARKIWDGLRLKALITNMPKVDCSTFTIDNLVSIKGLMGTYGVVPSQGAWIVGYKSLIKMMTVGQASQASAMLTLEKLGPMATVLTGQVGIFMGSPVILSEFTREDVHTTGKNTTAQANNTTTLLYVNREAFVVGDRRALQVRGSADRYIEMDQVVYVGTFRGDFKEYYPTAAAANKIVGIGINIT